MDKEIQQYRRLHPQCKWCKYYKYRYFVHYTDVSYEECILKDKIIRCHHLAKICRYYQLKEINNKDKEIK